MKRKALAGPLGALLVTLAISALQAAEPPLGIVLLHGKGGSPKGYIKPLADALEQRGYFVIAPEMPWSESRAYDAGVEAAMEEIDRAVLELKKRGGSKIFVGGHSMGANLAMHYGTRASVDGILAIAPGHLPDQAPFLTRLAGDVARARRSVAENRGDQKSSFRDINQGQVSNVRTTPRIYLSYFDPEGPTVMPRSAANIKPGTPLLWVVGASDPIHARGPSYAYELTPPHRRSKYLVINSDHLNTPRDAIKEIIEWLESFA